MSVTQHLVSLLKHNLDSNQVTLVLQSVGSQEYLQQKYIEPTHQMRQELENKQTVLCETVLKPIKDLIVASPHTTPEQKQHLTTIINDTQVNESVRHVAKSFLTYPFLGKKKQDELKAKVITQINYPNHDDPMGRRSNGNETLFALIAYALSPDDDHVRFAKNLFHYHQTNIFYPHFIVAFFTRLTSQRARFDVQLWLCPVLETLFKEHKLTFDMVNVDENIYYYEMTTPFHSSATLQELVSAFLVKYPQPVV